MKSICASFVFETRISGYFRFSAASSSSETSRSGKKTDDHVWQKFRQVPSSEIGALAEIGVKFAGRNLAAFVAANPGLVPKDFFKLVSGNRAAGVQRLDAGFEVEINEDFTEIEQDCFNLHP